MEGGTVYLKYPGNLEIPDNVIQQIQISHNFVEGKTASENYIITELKDWNSVSFCNVSQEIIIVLVLDKYDEGNDFISILGEFNSTFDHKMEKKELNTNLKSFFESLSDVFRTKDEVIAKLSNDVARLKMREYDLDRKFETVLNYDMNVKDKILYLLTINEGLSIKEIRKLVNTSNRWLDSVLKEMEKNKLIHYDFEDDKYFLVF